ncbi:MAG: hypothetical protein JXA11_16550 [Phycisphaerae bacterium]|nr:hypothetical protein [Phycisphaerae bacterium]
MMQIKCGQCGTLHDLERIEGMQSVRCAHCGHAVDYLNLAEDPAGSGTVCEGRFDDVDDFATQARQALRERMLVVCAHCGARIRVAKRLAGQLIHCTSCSKELHVPDTAAEDQVDISYLISPGDLVMGQDPRTIPLRARASRRRRRQALRNHMQFALKMLAAVMLLALIASVVYHGSSASNKDYLTPPPSSADAERVEGAETTPPEQVVDTSPPPEPKTTPPVAPAAPAGPVAALVDKPAWSAFAAGGYYPARPGRLYCTLGVKLQSSPDAPLKIKPADSVKLVRNDVSYACLGEVVEDALLPVRARRRTIRLAPAEETTVRLLFVLPQRAGQATLHLDSMTPLTVTLPAPGRAQTPPEGQFVESPPRNLKVLLRDPVMAAIQSQARQELRIRRNGSLLDVRIDAAEVIGQARPTGPDAWAVVLRHGPHSIEGTLRFLPDGQRIILYLSDEPMHQITYRRKRPDETDANGESPSPNEEDDDAPRFFGV